MKNWNEKSYKTLRLFRRDLAPAVYEQAKQHLDEILQQETVPPELASHAYVRIFPTIALYRALHAQDPDQAYQQLADLFWQKTVTPGAKWMRRIMKIPGLYKRIPKLVHKTVNKSYPESADGFQYELLETSENCMRITFHQCPYYSYCVKYGVPELCDVFCTSDEIVGDAMAPYIRFTRTQTLGRGGEFCDFCYEINPDYK